MLMTVRSPLPSSPTPSCNALSWDPPAPSILRRTKLRVLHHSLALHRRCIAYPPPTSHSHTHPPNPLHIPTASGRSPKAHSHPGSTGAPRRVARQTAVPTQRPRWLAAVPPLPPKRRPGGGRRGPPQLVSTQPKTSWLRRPWRPRPGGRSGHEAWRGDKGWVVGGKKGKQSKRNGAKKLYESTCSSARGMRREGVGGAGCQRLGMTRTRSTAVTQTRRQEEGRYVAVAFNFQRPTGFLHTRRWGLVRRHPDRHAHHFDQHWYLSPLRPPVGSTAGEQWRVAAAAHVPVPCPARPWQPRRCRAPPHRPSIPPSHRRRPLLPSSKRTGGDPPSFDQARAGAHHQGSRVCQLPSPSSPPYINFVQGGQPDPVHWTDIDIGAQRGSAPAPVFAGPSVQLDPIREGATATERVCSLVDLDQSARKKGNSGGESCLHERALGPQQGQGSSFSYLLSTGASS